MQFARPRPRARMRETTVPMINVVFLLLIFFLMTAQLTPPDPFEVTLPQSQATDPADPGDTLFIARDGTLGFGALRGAEAIDAAAGVEALAIRADANAPGQALAAAIAGLRRAAVKAGAEPPEVRLITTAPAP